MQSKPEQAPQNVDLTSILSRLEASEAKTKELEAKLNPENMLKKAKERYEWPRNYSYKTYWGVPVLSYKSVKKDDTKDFTFKNHLQVLTNNQDLELTFADWTTRKVDLHEFNNNFERSEKIPAEPITDWVAVTGYQFNVEPFGKFIVASNLIN